MVTQAAPSSSPLPQPPAPEISHNAPDPPGAAAETKDDAPPHDPPLAVRFASAVEEIAPPAVVESLSLGNEETTDVADEKTPPPTEEGAATQTQPQTQTDAKDGGGGGPAQLPEVTPEDLRELSKSLQGRHLQERRMNIFAFEPFSLPASRVHSYDDESRDSSRLPTPSSIPTPSAAAAPTSTTMTSPPLTPAGTDPAEAEVKKSPSPADAAPVPSINEPHPITPQASSSHDSSGSPGSTGHKDGGGAEPLPRRPASSSSNGLPQRSSSAEEREPPPKSHRRGLFSIGPGGSTPVSRESSPSRTAASQLYSKPFAPSGDANDPYAASRRTPHAGGSSSRNQPIDARFVFSLRRKGSPTSSSTAGVAGAKSEKRHSSFLGAFKGGYDDGLTPHASNATGDVHSRPGSMADLKRFFKTGGHNKAKRDASPSSQRSGARTPPSARSGTAGSTPQRVPFGDDHGLSSKYGKLGRVLGSGAGGSVRIMKRSDDNTVFAVKEFRPRHSYETEKEYVKKLTAEFCVGSTLHHGNIIETLDILQEKGKWFEVMEYAPFDLFAIVMTGRMTREEIRCCFLQILNGVTYLHSMGLAHRDLKLDNVVVSEFGIMKIIDFGSAHVFKYPFESSIVPASGIVGSDPYLAPEVYEERKYDPQAVDIWSLAIIFCCMSLRRFPWKVPRTSDSSFRLFAAEPTPGHDPKKLILPSRSTNDLANTPPRDIFTGSGDDENMRGRRHHHRNSHGTAAEDTPAPQANDTPAAAPAPAPAPAPAQAAVQAEPRKSTDAPAPVTEKKEVIRGPWRILRLLPRESRHVIGRMLEIDSRQRARMPEILEEGWVANTVICQQTGMGTVVNAADHVHVLEPPAGASSGGTK